MPRPAGAAARRSGQTGSGVEGRADPTVFGELQSMFVFDMRFDAGAIMTRCRGASATIVFGDERYSAFKQKAIFVVSFACVNILLHDAGK